MIQQKPFDPYLCAVAVTGPRWDFYAAPHQCANHPLNWAVVDGQEVEVCTMHLHRIEAGVEVLIYSPTPQ